MAFAGILARQPSLRGLAPRLTDSLTRLAANIAGFGAQVLEIGGAKTFVRRRLSANRRRYAVLSARRAAPEPAMTTTIRNTPRTTDCQ